MGGAIFFGLEMISESHHGDAEGTEQRVLFQKTLRSLRACVSVVNRISELEHVEVF